jgi:hypothetical protein
MSESVAYVARRLCRMNLDSFQPTLSVLSDDPDDCRILWTETMLMAMGGVWHVVRFFDAEGRKQAWGARFHSPRSGSSGAPQDRGAGASTRKDEARPDGPVDAPAPRPDLGTSSRRGSRRSGGG